MGVRRGAVALISLCLLTVLLAEGVSAQSYLPLEYGRTWELKDSSGGVWRTRVAGQVTLAQRAVHVLKRTTPEGRIWNYWSEAADGTISLHGFKRPDSEVGAIYDPPLEWIRPELSAGLQWQIQTSVTDFTTGIAIGSLSMSVQVGNQRIIRLPRGDFAAWPIEYSSAGPPTLNRQAPSRYNLLGEVTAAPDNSLLRQEYALDHGLIRETVCCPDDVRVLQLQIVPTRPTRWGEFKSHYREPR
jgi:hypothetical protein